MNKKKIYLILTPIRSTYPENYKGIIVFLGNKDFEYLKEKNPDATIEKIETIWSDKDKLFTDIKYLSLLEENFYKKIGEALSKFFNFKNNDKYWSIYLRPTVFVTLTLLYERWLQIEDLKEKYIIEDCKFIENRNEDFIAFDPGSFYNLIQTDNFNQIIYQNILETQNIKFNKYKNQKKTVDNFLQSPFKIEKILFILKKVKMKNFFYIFKLFLNKIKNYFNLLSIKGKKFNYIQSDIDQELFNKLNTFFKQKNCIIKIKNIKSKKPADLKARNILRSFFFFDPSNNFEKFSKVFIFKILPKCFIENLTKVQKSNSYYNNSFKFNFGILLYDEIFGNNFCQLEWIAKNYMGGSKIILAQTGGGPATAETSTIRTLIKKFKFKELSFGVEDDIKKNILGVGFFRCKKNDENFFQKDGKVIYALYPPYGYTGSIKSTIPLGNEWIEYMTSHEKLIESLDIELKKNLILRFRKRQTDYHLYDKRLKNKFPDILIDNCSTTFQDRLKKSRLLITTLDSTTFLEGLAYNFPTILIINFNKFKLTPESLNYYKDLEDVKIIFNKPIEAKKHIENIFFDVESWWKNKDVQEARLKFCKKFSYIPKDLDSYFINKVSKIIT